MKIIEFLFIVDLQTLIYFLLLEGEQVIFKP